MRIWDSKNGKEIVRLTGHNNSVYCARYSHDGLKIVTADNGGIARIF